MKSAVLLGVCLFAVCAIKASRALTGGKTFTFVSTPKTYFNAQEQCKNDGGTLAEPMNKAENDIVSKITGGAKAYIGFNDISYEGTWLSNSGDKFCYTNWNTGEPNNQGNNEDCAEINFGKQTFWNDIPCTLQRAFVCQKYNS